MHYSSPVRDAPILLPNGTKWPHNYEMKTTPDNGDVLLGVALQKSLNTVAARLVQQLTPQRSYEYATNIFQLSTLVENKAIGGSIFTDKDLSPLALGAFTEGVTARDMATAYAVYGSGGYHNEPFTYYSVTTGDIGDETVLLEGGKKSVEVLDPETCYVMVKLMQRVTLYGTAADVGRSWSGWEIYGKTGTSESNRDVYFTGGSPYYAAASWFGYDNNQVMVGSQTSYAKSLWNKAMKVLHKDLEIKEFTAPEGVQAWKYCTATGQRATSACPKSEMGWYKSTNVPDYCTAHNGTPLNPDGSLPEAPTTSTTPPQGESTTVADSTTTTTSTQTSTQEETTTTTETGETTTTTSAEASE